MNMQANGISINYEIQGEGRNLVLLHGAGDNLGMWYHQLPAFTLRYRVITVDMRGSGQTDAPPGPYSIPLLAQDVYGLMQGLGVEDALWLGYSMGGRVALEIAIEHPEMVRALVLANSGIGGRPLSKERMERRKQELELLAKGEMQKFAEQMAESAFSPGFRKRNPAEFERYMRVKAQNRPEGIAGVMGTLGKPAPFDLSKVNCPVLIIAGEHDGFMNPELARQTQQAIKGSKLVIFPTGHASAIEAPQEFNKAVLEFLGKVV
jgi:3-oxoadipate enol-lactonase